MSRPILLDLFCGAGGASMGYYRAGFDVIGIDIEPMPRYPFDFIQADAIEFLDRMITDRTWSGVSVIHASPPCQGYSVTKSFNPRSGEYPLWIGGIRDRLIQTELPYVIENVEGAARDMRNPLKLCGSHFGLTAIWEPFGLVGLRRHRLFESNVFLPVPRACDHRLLSVPVFGHGPSGAKARLHGLGHSQAERDVMQINWMSREEINEAIPPVYSSYIGAHLLPYLAARESLIDTVTAAFNVPRGILGLGLAA